MIKLYFIFIAFFCLPSCQENKQKTNSDTIIEGDIATTISADTGKLAKIIDLSKYKPTHVKFKYSHNNSSGDRLTVPSPSESDLEAILYFDSAQFNYLKAKYFSVPDSVPNCNSQWFNFDWLDKETKAELSNIDTTNNRQAGCFKFGFDGRLWLKNKILMFEARN